MVVHFLVVPQWQGSGSSRAMQLVDGAEAIAADLPAAACSRVEVPLEAGDAEGTGVQRFSSLRLVRERIAAALERVPEGRVVVTVGGDCGADYQSIASTASGRRLALLWFGAHAAANSPESSPSGAFCGMVVRALVDDGVLAAERIVLAGTRDWDPGEAEWAADAGVHRCSPAELADTGALTELLAGLDADGLYVHVDLDALDPAEFDQVSAAEPFGVPLDRLLGAIAAARAALPLLGAGVTGFSPSGPDAASEAMPTILRVIGALSRA